MKWIFFLSTIFSFLACQKNQTAQQKIANGLNIERKWKLTESLADPGDGSGIWTQANPVNPSFVEFKKDGNVIFTPADQYGTNHRYKLLSDSTMIFFRDAEQFNYSYKLSDNELTLYPPCIEACGLKYRAVN